MCEVISSKSPHLDPDRIKGSFEYRLEFGEVFHLKGYSVLSATTVNLVIQYTIGQRAFTAIGHCAECDWNICKKFCVVGHCVELGSVLLATVPDLLKRQGPMQGI